MTLKSILPRYLLLYLRMQKLITNKDLKVLVKNSQTPKGLNEQAVKELRKLGFYKSLNKTANSVLNRLKKSK